MGRRTRLLSLPGGAGGHLLHSCLVGGAALPAPPPCSARMICFATFFSCSDPSYGEITFPFPSLTKSNLWFVVNGPKQGSPWHQERRWPPGRTYLMGISSVLSVSPFQTGG